MTEKENERSFFDRTLHNLSTEENNRQQPRLNEDFYGSYISSINGYRMNQVPYYWNVPAAYSSYSYYPTYDYAPYESHQYPVMEETPPTPVSKTPVNKSKSSLPPAPKGRAPPEPTQVNSSLSFAYGPPMAYNPVQTAMVTAPPVQYSQPFPMQPQYYYDHFPPQAYYPYSWPSHYYDQYHPVASYYPRERYDLPPIPRRDTYRERDYHDQRRRRRDRPVIMSYLGIQRPQRWYH